MRSCSLWHWGNETVGKFCAVVYAKLLSTAKCFIVIQNFLKAAYWFQFSHEAYSHLLRYPQRAAMFYCHKNVIYFLCARKRGLSILQSCFPISQDSIISYAFLCAYTNENFHCLYDIGICREATLQNTNLRHVRKCIVTIKHWCHLGDYSVQVGTPR